jgi:hypothetical protein
LRWDLTNFFLLGFISNCNPSWVAGITGLYHNTRPFALFVLKLDKPWENRKTWVNLSYLLQNYK